MFLAKSTIWQWHLNHQSASFLTDDEPTSYWCGVWLFDFLIGEDPVAIIHPRQKSFLDEYFSFSARARLGNGLTRNMLNPCVPSPPVIPCLNYWRRRVPLISLSQSFRNACSTEQGGWKSSEKGLIFSLNETILGELQPLCSGCNPNHGGTFTRG